MFQKFWKQFLVLFVGVLALVGCGQGGSSDDSSQSETETAETETTQEKEKESEDTTSDDSADGEKIDVVVTTTHLTDLFEQIGGEYVNVEGLMGPGIDPHGYNATASDVEKMNNADIVGYHGLHLEGKMEDIFEEMESSDKTVVGIEKMFESDDLLLTEEDSGEVDPHIWFDVQLWKMAADHVTKALQEYAPEYEAEFGENNIAYQKELDELDLYIKSRVDEVPEGSRYLVTAHDAFNYFGKSYNFEVVGLQGISTESEAGTADVSELADFIVENQIKAIFVESSVPTRTIEALQEAVKDRGFEVSIGGELYSDALGDEESGHDTYVKMYEANIDTIVDALK